MRRLTVPLLLAALAAAPVLSGCGAEELAGVDVAKAAETTTGKGTARMAMTVRMSGVGLPAPMEFEAEGVTALGEPRMSMSMNFGELLSTLGADAEGKLEMRLNGGNLYLKPPKIEGVDLPGGGGWIGLDLSELARAMGIDPEAASVLFTMDPASQMRAMRAAGGLETVGSEKIDGVETTHLKGTTSTQDTIAALPADKREAARKAIEQLESVAGAGSTDQQVPTELWVDEDSIIRRMRMSSKLPSQNGAPAGEFDITYDLSDFGAELDVSEPGDVTDLTDRLAELLEAQSGALKNQSGASAG